MTVSSIIWQTQIVLRIMQLHKCLCRSSLQTKLCHCWRNVTASAQVFECCSRLVLLQLCFFCISIWKKMCVSVRSVHLLYSCQVYESSIISQLQRVPFLFRCQASVWGVSRETQLSWHFTSALFGVVLWPETSPLGRTALDLERWGSGAMKLLWMWYPKRVCWCCTFPSWSWNFVCFLLCISD